MSIEIKNIILLILILKSSFYCSAQQINILPKYHLGVVNNRQSNDRALFLQAAREQNINLIDSFLAKEFDINEPDVFGATILSEIVENSTSIIFIDLLLQRGACLNCSRFVSQYVLKEGIESDYRIPLNYAIINRDTNVFIFLLKKYENLRFDDVLSKRELIETALIKGNYKALLELSKYFDFTNVNDRNIIGQTLLTQMAEAIAISYLLLLDEEKNTEIKDLLNNGIKIMEFLIAKGADINKSNEKGETALSLLKDIPLLNDFLVSKKAK